MRNALVLTAMLGFAACLAVGCSFDDENVNSNPGDAPASFSDAPFYYAPKYELKPAEWLGKGQVGKNKEGIPVYYTQDAAFFIKHPLSEQGDELPRTRFMVSSNSGKRWVNGGGFGLDAKYYYFDAQTDGSYWVRFIGPGFEYSKVPPGQPHRIYVLDTKPPKIDVKITPGIWMDKKKTRRRIFRAGEKITVSWRVRDTNIKVGSVKLDTCFARFPNNVVWKEIPQKIATTGSLDIRIPAEAVNQSGIRFRIRAVDKAGNVGIGMSRILDVRPRQVFFRTKKTSSSQHRKQMRKLFDQKDKDNIFDADPENDPTNEPRQDNKLTADDLKNNKIATNHPASKFVKRMNVTGDDEADNNQGTVKPEPETQPEVVITKGKTDSSDKEDTIVNIGTDDDKTGNTTSQKSADDKVETIPSKTESEVKPDKPAVANRPTQEEIDEKIKNSIPENDKNVATKPDKKASLSDFETDEPKSVTKPLSDKSGWPAKAAAFTAGASRVMKFMPTEAKNYKTVKLQFTADNGKTWKTIIRKLSSSRPNIWRVPTANSKNCMLRMVAVDAQGGIVVLAKTPKFTVKKVDWDSYDFDS